MNLTRTIDQSVILLGDRTKLKDLLRFRLTECGWCDEVRLLCREYVKEDDGNVNVDRLIQQITLKSRSIVPDTVKKELLQKIKNILLSRSIDEW